MSLQQQMPVRWCHASLAVMVVLICGSQVYVSIARDMVLRLCTEELVMFEVAMECHGEEVRDEEWLDVHYSLTSR